MALDFFGRRPMRHVHFYEDLLHGLVPGAPGGLAGHDAAPLLEVNRHAAASHRLTGRLTSANSPASRQVTQTVWLSLNLYCCVCTDYVAWLSLIISALKPVSVFIGNVKSRCVVLPQTGSKLLLPSVWIAFPVSEDILVAAPPAVWKDALQQGKPELDKLSAVSVLSIL